MVFFFRKERDVSEKRVIFKEREGESVTREIVTSVLSGFCPWHLTASATRSFGINPDLSTWSR